MPERPALQKHNSASSILSAHASFVAAATAAAAAGRSPSGRLPNNSQYQSHHGALNPTFQGGKRVRLAGSSGGGVAGARNLPGQRGVLLPRVAATSTARGAAALRKNQSETALHRRGRSSTDLAMAVAAADARAKAARRVTTTAVASLGQSPGRSPPATEDGEEVDEISTGARRDTASDRHRRRTSLDAIRGSALTPAADGEGRGSEHLAPPSQRQRQRRREQQQQQGGSDADRSNWEDGVAESFDFDAERSMIERAARQNPGATASRPGAADENVLPLQPYTGHTSTGLVRLEAAASVNPASSTPADKSPPAPVSLSRGEQSETAETTTDKGQITLVDRSGKAPPSAHGHSVSFALPKLDRGGSSAKPEAGPRKQSEAAKAHAASAPPPSSQQHQQQQQQQPQQQQQQQPGAFNIQSNLDRDRIKTMQPEYALPPSAWKSHRLVEATPYLTDPRSEYTAKFLNRWDREVARRLECLRNVQDPLAESWERMLRGTALAAAAASRANNGGATVAAADRRDRGVGEGGATMRKKPEQSSASLAAWFGGLAVSAAAAATSRVDAAHHHQHAERERREKEAEAAAAELEAVDDDDWLQETQDILEELDEHHGGGAAFASQVRAALRDRLAPDAGH